MNQQLEYIDIPHESLKTRLRVRLRGEKVQCWLCGRIEPIANLPEDIIGLFDSSANLVEVSCKSHYVR